MLARQHRLHRSADFAAVLRHGTRAGRGTLTVHVHRSAREPLGPVRVGLVVSKAVGDAVTRHRVSRRLRHQLFPFVTGPDALAPGSMLVVRAGSASAEATSETLGADLASAVRSAVGKRSRP